MIVYVSFSFVQSLSRYGFLVCFDFWLCQGHGMAPPNMTYTESLKPATRRLVTCFENASLDTLLVVVLSYSHRACKIWTDPSQGLVGIRCFWKVPGSPPCSVCHQGDLDVLDMLLFTGDSENKFPGDINTQRS